MFVFRQLLFVVLCVGGLGLFIQYGYAQTAVEQAAQQNQDLIQDFEQEKRFKDQQELLEREQKALGADLGYNPTQLPQTGPCINVHTLDTQGITLLPNKSLDTLKEQYQGQCLFLSDMNAITETINGLYIDKGYISSRAYLPQQDLSSGVLRIQVIEGTLEKINADHDEIFNFDQIQSQFLYAFPGMLGQPLNIRDIEQGLDQINRLQSNDATMDLLPGSKVGGSIISVKNKPKKPWMVRTSIDNSGTQSTGVLQGSLYGTYDDVFGANDLLSLNVKHDLDNTKNRQSKNFGFTYEVPFGYWNVSYGLSYFDYISEVQTLAQTFKTSGRTRNHTLAANNVLYRDQNGKISLNTSVVFKESENYFAGTKLDVSSRKLSIANIGLSHSRSIPNGFLYGAVSYARGLKIFGAFKEKSTDPTAPVGQFDRLSFDANVIKQFDFGWNSYNPRLDVRGNAVLSPDSLFSSEQLSIGGPYSVRGFKTDSISGDRGGYIRADLSTALPPLPEPSLNKIIGTVKPFVGFDIGAISSDNAVATEGGVLKSMSIGVKNVGGQVDFGVTYTKPISSPRFINHESEELFLQLSVKF